MNPEIQTEEAQRQSFTEEERGEITTLISVAYRSDEQTEALNAPAEERGEARKRLEEIGCDLSEADRLATINPDLGPGQLVDFVIRKGKAVSPEASESSESGGGEHDVFNKGLTETSRIHVGGETNGVEVEIRPGSEKGSLVAVYLGQELPLHEGTNTVGRNPDSDVFINVPSVSRVHAEIQVFKDGYVVVDKNSLNGTREA